MANVAVACERFCAEWNATKLNGSCTGGTDKGCCDSSPCPCTRFFASSDKGYKPASQCCLKGTYYDNTTVTRRSMGGLPGEPGYLNRYYAVGSSPLTCEAVSCGLAPSPPHSTGSCIGPQTFGQTCKATCDSGYTGGSNGSAVFTCGADRQFTPRSVLSCDAVSCGLAPSPPHSTGSCIGPQTFGQNCTAACHSGYTGGSNSSAVFTCGADGHFTGSLTCAPRPCQNADAAPVNGNARGCQKPTMQSGDHCTPECDKGQDGKYG